MKRLIGVCLLLLFLMMIWSDSTLWEDDKYAVYVIDGQAHFGLKAGDDIYIGRFEPEIVAVGSNSEYVVIQRRIRGDILYFYINKAQDHGYLNADEIVYAGYQKDKFEQLKASHGLPEFSVFF
ncbi:hypothetical protein FE810_03865 [Thalassotalea litorea]|uniref:Uncharacterized protein n=1 Tax=Thalassotalea litorea TaxID=2020715 RepID=A0A5R9IPY2_9GAMM|nr:hypothetical protein [Thalassotalea litorea]TLU66659.1 hypothetical protein FE810_03865 [Thalassotalea litorea]